MKYISLAVLIVLFVGCKSSEKIPTSQTSTGIETEVIISENQVLFQIKNISNDTVLIYNPQKLTIQRLENDKWENVRILLCPCDAPCNAPIEKAEIYPRESYSISWNKEESWCGERTQHGIRKTEKIKTLNGHYRIIIKWFYDMENIKEFYKEFEII